MIIFTAVWSLSRLTSWLVISLIASSLKRISICIHPSSYTYPGLGCFSFAAIPEILNTSEFHCSLSALEVPREDIVCVRLNNALSLIIILSFAV